MQFPPSSSICIHLTTGDYTRPVSAGEWNRSRRGKLRYKRPKPQGSSDSYASPPCPKSSWPSSESSHPQIGEPYSAHPQPSPLQTPYYTMVSTQPGTEQHPRPQQLPGATPLMLPDQNQFTYNFGVTESTGMQPIQMESIQNFHNLQPMSCPAQTIHPYMTPVMAVILPQYPTLAPGFPSFYPPSAPSLLPQAPINMAAFVPGATHFPQPLFQAEAPSLHQSPLGPLLCSPRASSSIGEEEEAAGPPALFSSSRSSSPLQLNLLQEELPKPCEGPGSTGHNHSESLHEQHANEVRRVDVTLHLKLLTLVMPLVDTICIQVGGRATQKVLIYCMASSRVTTLVILGITMHSLLLASCLTCYCKRTPGQGRAPMRLGQAPWDLDLAPMEPPHHTPVKEKAHASISFAAC